MDRFDARNLLCLRREHAAGRLQQRQRFVDLVMCCLNARHRPC